MTGDEGQAFYFGLEAFGRDFQGIESYVEVRLSETVPPVRQALRSISFAYSLWPDFASTSVVDTPIRSHTIDAIRLVQRIPRPRTGTSHRRKNSGKTRAPHNRRRDFATRIRKAWEKTDAIGVTV